MEIVNACETQVNHFSASLRVRQAERCSKLGHNGLEIIAIHTPDPALGDWLRHAAVGATAKVSHHSKRKRRIRVAWTFTGRAEGDIELDFVGGHGAAKAKG